MKMNWLQCYFFWYKFVHASAKACIKIYLKFSYSIVSSGINWVYGIGLIQVDKVGLKIDFNINVKDPLTRMGELKSFRRLPIRETEEVAVLSPPLYGRMNSDEMDRYKSILRCIPMIT